MTGLVPESSKEIEVFGRMDILLEERGFVRTDQDVALYRRGNDAIAVVRVPSLHDPIKAVSVSGTPAAWNARGLAILLDAAEGG